MWIQGVKHLMSAIKYTAIIAHLYVLADSKIEERIMEVSMSNDCNCPDDIVTYACTVVGDIGGITLWMGDFFRCPNGKQEILLLHSDFTEGRGVETYSTQMCNDGNIVGRIIGVENGIYTSQLNVTLTSDIAGKSIECSYDNGTELHRVGSVNLITALNTPSPPAKIRWITNYPQSTLIAFIWNTNSPDCPAIHYNILASNCGSCPTTTNYTTATCIDVPADSSMCTFTVQTVICGNITGESSQVLLNNIPVGSSECGPALISAISLGVALVICLTGLTSVIVTVLLMKSKTKVGTVVVNTKVHKDQGRNASIPLSSHVNTKKNIAYVAHSLETDAN